MGDVRRFDLFGKVISKYIDKNAKIADIAGGKGYLQLNLRERGYQNIITYDKRFYRARYIDFSYSYFHWKCTELYDVIVGMHPDEGTEHILAYANLHKVPFVVCPCCVKPDLTCWHGKPNNWSYWLQHLIKLVSGFHIFQEILPMNGRNVCLIGIPY